METGVGCPRSFGRRSSLARSAWHRPLPRSRPCGRTAPPRSGARGCRLRAGRVPPHRHPATPGPARPRTGGARRAAALPGVPQRVPRGPRSSAGSRGRLRAGSAAAPATDLLAARLPRPRGRRRRGRGGRREGEAAAAPA